MKKIFTLLSGTVLLAAGSPAFAQATRTWVSGVGDDANPCSRTAPCKTFAGAISKTATGGEINCLDPGGFGTLTITKSITIDCGPYTMGGVLASNVNGFLINGAGAIVTLRGVTIDNVNTTTGNGIRILAAATVNVEDVVIENFGGTGTQGRGISIETATAGVRVNVTNSQFYSNNGVAIFSTPTAGNVFLTVDGTTIIGRSTNNGIQLTTQTTATVNGTSITGTNAAVATELTSVALMVSNSNLSNNAIGVFNGNAGGGPTTRLYATVITGNTSQGILNNAGSVISSGNNVIRGNAGNEVPTSTITTQ